MAGGKGQRLEPLTSDMPKPAVPFGGTYRLIDFTLSNCLNSGLAKIIVLVQYRSTLLNRHIRDGWQVYFVRALGNFVEAIPPQHKEGEQWYSGTADSIYQNLYMMEKEEPDYVIILAGDHIYKMNYRHMLAFHHDNDADLTVGAVEVRKEDVSNFGILQVDSANKVTGFLEKPKTAEPLKSHPDFCLASMGIYVFKPNVMYKVLEADAKDKKSSHDFGKDIIPKMVDSNYKVQAFSFIDENSKEAKYWRDVGTIDAYFEANMDLVSVSPHLNLYSKNWPVRTVPIQAPPPKFVFASKGRTGAAFDSMVSAGCIISGGEVRRSILSPHVRVNSYSQVDESIIFDNVEIGRQTKIKRAIIDSGVVIPEGTEIGYNAKEDKKRFTVSDGGIVVVSKGDKF